MTFEKFSTLAQKRPCHAKGIFTGARKLQEPQHYGSPLIPNEKYTLSRLRNRTRVLNPRDNSDYDLTVRSHVLRPTSGTRFDHISPITQRVDSRRSRRVFGVRLAHNQHRTRYTFASFRIKGVFEKTCNTSVG